MLMVRSTSRKLAIRKMRRPWFTYTRKQYNTNKLSENALKNNEAVVP
jgi:hypothetical protein